MRKKPRRPVQHLRYPVQRSGRHLGRGRGALPQVIQKIDKFEEDFDGDVLTSVFPRADMLT